MNTDQIKTLAPVDQLIAVNTAINDLIRYTPDTSDNEWQPLDVTLERKTGDCEDFAIAKFTLLSQLQHPWDVRVAIVRDFGINHAICIAIPPLSAIVDGLVLDNQRFELLPFRDTHYGMLLSFNWTTLFVDNRKFTGFGSLDKWEKIASNHTDFRHSV